MNIEKRRALLNSFFISQINVLYECVTVMQKKKNKKKQLRPSRKMSQDYLQWQIIYF